MRRIAVHVALEPEVEPAQRRRFLSGVCRDAATEALDHWRSAFPGRLGVTPPRDGPPAVLRDGGAVKSLAISLSQSWPLGGAFVSDEDCCVGLDLVANRLTYPEPVVRMISTPADRECWRSLLDRGKLDLGEPERVMGLFAVKEAVLKAIGTGVEGGFDRLRLLDPCANEAGPVIDLPTLDSGEGLWTRLVRFTVRDEESETRFRLEAAWNGATWLAACWPARPV